MPEDGELSFSLYELRKILGWSDDSGGAYKEIRDALLRIATTSMQSRNAFYSAEEDRKSTRLNSSHANISYAVFCLKNKIYPHTNLVSYTAHLLLLFCYLP